MTSIISAKNHRLKIKKSKIEKDFITIATQAPTPEVLPRGIPRNSSCWESDYQEVEPGVEVVVVGADRGLDPIAPPAKQP